jgi:hypothetical protein
MRSAGIEAVKSGIEFGFESGRVFGVFGLALSF